MTDEKAADAGELTQEELDGETADQLPEREAMSLLSTRPVDLSMTLDPPERAMD